MATKADELTKDMVAWYDEIATQDAVWGEYLHHGYYGLDEPAHVSTNHAAERRMVDEVLKFAGISGDPSKRPKNIIDVGCGFGGAAIYLAKKYGANCCGINLSPAQIQKAKELAAASGLGDRASFIVGDALNQPFPDGQFDLVWSMEVMEHAPDKLKFISELARIAAPGATIIFTSCCHRDLFPGETSLKPDEKNLIDKILKTLHQYSYISPSDTVKVVQSLALHVRLLNALTNLWKCDGGKNVIPYFRATVQSQRTWQGLASMLLNGWTYFKMSQNWPLMLKAYEKGVTKLTVVACRKPE